MSNKANECPYCKKEVITFWMKVKLSFSLKSKIVDLSANEMNCPSCMKVIKLEKKQKALRLISLLIIYGLFQLSVSPYMPGFVFLCYVIYDVFRLQFVSVVKKPNVVITAIE